MRGLIVPPAPMPATPVAAPAVPTVWARAAAATSAAAEKCKAGVRTVTVAARTLGSIVPLKRVAVVGVAAGAVIAGVSYAAPTPSPR